MPCTSSVLDKNTDGRTWATLNDLPHSSNGGGIKISQVKNSNVIFSPIYQVSEHAESAKPVCYPTNAQCILTSDDWADAKDNLSLRWMKAYFEVFKLFYDVQRGPFS